MDVDFLDGVGEEVRDFEVDLLVGVGFVGVGVGIEAGFILEFAGGPGVDIGVEEPEEGLDGVSLAKVDVEGAITGCLFETDVDGDGPRAGVDVPELPFFGVAEAKDVSVFAVAFATATTLWRLPSTSAPAETAKSGAEDTILFFVRFAFALNMAPAPATSSTVEAPPSFRCTSLPLSVPTSRSSPSPSSPSPSSKSITSMPFSSLFTLSSINPTGADP